MRDIVRDVVALPQRIPDDPPQVRGRERLQRQRLHCDAGGSDRLQLRFDPAGRRMDPVAACADQQQALALRIGHERADHAPRRAVRPLQIVHEQHERMLLMAEQLNEPAEHELEPFHGFLQRQLLDRRLLADDPLHLGDDVRNDARIGAERLNDSLPPLIQALLVLVQQLLRQLAESGDERRHRGILLQGLEFAGDQIRLSQGDPAGCFLDEHRFPDARRPRHADHLGRPERGPMKRLSDARDLAIPSVQPFRQLVFLRRFRRSNFRFHLNTRLILVSSLCLT